MGMVLFLSGLGSCSGARQEKDAARATPVVAPSSDDDWAHASWEDHHDTMTFTVLPVMGRLFQQHDGKPDAELTCRSCHGADAEAVGYAMPHGLPPLDPKHMPDPNEATPRGRMARFMTDRVTPEMIELLEVSPYDPRTGRGFGCFSCHPRVP